MKFLIAELQYRFLYCLVTFLFLTTLVYFNFGYQVEYFWSYFYHHYQAIDFCWKESICYGASNLFPESSNQLSGNEHAWVRPTHAWSAVQGDSSKAQVFDLKSSSFDFKASSCFNSNSCDFEKLDLFTYEIQEWQPLFLSHMYHFNDHIRLDKISQGIWLPFLFYQCVWFLGYHIYTFVAPAVLNRSRLILSRLCLVGLCLTLCHSSCCFLILQLVEEFSIESIDSELFTKTNFSNQFIDLWLYAFYINVICLCFNVLICSLFILKPLKFSNLFECVKPGF